MELLIVIVVLGILAGTVIFALGGTTAQAAEAACNSDAKTVETAVVAYEADPPANVAVGTAPSSVNDLVPNYLHSAPSNTSYAITIVSGAVMVAVPATGPGVSYDTSPNPCSSLATSGGGGGGGSPAVVPPGGGGGGTPTTTTTVAPTTTTTVPPTTTTTTISNGVTATPSTNTYNGYGGQDILAVRNTRAITAMTITIRVAQTTGVTPNGGYNSFPGGVATTTYGTGSGSGTLTSTYVLNAGHTIPAGSPSGSFAAQYGGTGSPRVQTGDTWTVVSTSNGVTSTISGHF
jgi:hypothetical protein